ncbi:putative tetratricopeptide repeat protein 5 isoform X1 [Apostichopus japonicus]|uniref:Putative tetratricopeptide repeat protein 5 isoform X1 n=1 Tax=Stichopus japonicus TaxID=307972 RepID=A0A2G8K8D1_STIJA|nr:putative tetratricopeptide repeat protein 5 isoform X1 [Apostichopus japonicus]
MERTAGETERIGQLFVESVRTCQIKGKNFVEFEVVEDIGVMRQVEKQEAPTIDIIFDRGRFRAVRRGSYTGANKETVKLEPCPLSKLVEGKNLEKVVVGKVVCSVSLDEPIPFTFAIVDSEGSCYVVNLYNVAQGQGVIIGDSVAIPEPHIMKNDLSVDDKRINFFSIRVLSPIYLVVNRRKLGADKQAPATLQVSTLGE